MLMPVNQIGSYHLVELINRLLLIMQRTSDKTFLRTRTVEVLAQCMDDMAHHPRLQTVTLPLEDAAGIYHVRNLLLEQYEQNWTMKKLSEKTGLNYYKIELGFQQLYGKSPADYLRAIRMEKAWQLLPGKKYSVAQVAEMVGYTNLSAFSKAFKKYHHITARERQRGN
jgi:AraC-like DNA-binding protein